MPFMSHGLSQSTRLNWLQQSYAGIVSIAMLWTVANCLYVYLLLNGNRSYRIEAAAFLLTFLMLPLVILGRREQDPHSFNLSPRHRYLLFSIAIALWLATFLPLLRFPFLSDDYVFLSLYKGFGDVLHASQFFRPAFAVFFWALTRIGGGSFLPFHIASLLLHFSAACFVYWLARRLFAASAPASVSFVIFLLNPLQLEATLWSAGLQELLWTVLLLAALRCYVGSQRLSPFRLAGTIALVGCALLSKETAVCFVLLLPAADWVFFRMHRGPLLASAYATFVITLVAYFLVRRGFASIQSTFFVLPSKFFVKQFLATPYKFSWSRGMYRPSTFPSRFFVWCPSGSSHSCLPRL